MDIVKNINDEIVKTTSCCTCEYDFKDMMDMRSKLQEELNNLKRILGVKDEKITEMLKLHNNEKMAQQVEFADLLSKKDCEISQLKEICCC